ncbi:hypothetical protein AMAG_16027 [Allomyces macrogynus ATCC 38327]|uniref:Uncharacterized protein n=1 Tax=Allomyces macrogynus (strain ATCC 38327) TaxID=578462 RepID=A0A0L0TAJ3_ALLM3|nr:hypothetical protein AMAG_16027 [Allomyces macrogynus ATCC 38327]|eukprot:KNE71720.1 hypothetical protein AMAG_16027 [Allomyces macrogynus ATCC 38327]
MLLARDPTVNRLRSKDDVHAFLATPQGASLPGRRVAVRALLLLHEFDEVHVLLDQLRHDLPHDQEVRALTGKALEGQGRFDEALQAYAGLPNKRQLVLECQRARILAADEQGRAVDDTLLIAALDDPVALSDLITHSAPLLADLAPSDALVEAIAARLVRPPGVFRTAADAFQATKTIVHFVFALDRLPPAQLDTVLHAAVRGCRHSLALLCMLDSFCHQDPHVPALTKLYVADHHLTFGAGHLDHWSGDHQLTTALARFHDLRDRSNVSMAHPCSMHANAADALHDQFAAGAVAANSPDAVYNRYLRLVTFVLGLLKNENGADAADPDCNDTILLSALLRHLTIHLFGSLLLSPDLTFIVQSVPPIALHTAWPLELPGVIMEMRGVMNVSSILSVRERDDQLILAQLTQDLDWAVAVFQHWLTDPRILTWLAGAAAVSPKVARSMLPDAPDQPEPCITDLYSYLLIVLLHRNADVTSHANDDDPPRAHYTRRWACSSAQREFWTHLLVANTAAPEFGRRLREVRGLTTSTSVYHHLLARAVADIYADLAARFDWTDVAVKLRAHYLWCSRVALDPHLAAATTDNAASPLFVAPEGFVAAALERFHKADAVVDDSALTAVPPAISAQAQSLSSRPASPARARAIESDHGYSRSSSPSPVSSPRAPVPKVDVTVLADARLQRRLQALAALQRRMSDSSGSDSDSAASVTEAHAIVLPGIPDVLRKFASAPPAVEPPVTPVVGDASAKPADRDVDGETKHSDSSNVSDDDAMDVDSDRYSASRSDQRVAESALSDESGVESDVESGGADSDVSDPMSGIEMDGNASDESSIAPGSDSEQWEPEPEHYVATALTALVQQKQQQQQQQQHRPVPEHVADVPEHILSVPTASPAFSFAPYTMPTSPPNAATSAPLAATVFNLAGGAAALFPKSTPAIQSPVPSPMLPTSTAPAPTTLLTGSFFGGAALAPSVLSPFSLSGSASGSPLGRPTVAQPPLYSPASAAGSVDPVPFMSQPAFRSAPFSFGSPSRAAPDVKSSTIRSIMSVEEAKSPLLEPAVDAEAPSRRVSAADALASPFGQPLVAATSGFDSSVPSSPTEPTGPITPTRVAIESASRSPSPPPAPASAFAAAPEMGVFSFASIMSGRSRTDDDHPSQLLNTSTGSLHVPTTAPFERRIAPVAADYSKNTTPAFSPRSSIVIPDDWANMIKPSSPPMPAPTPSKKASPMMLTEPMIPVPFSLARRHDDDVPLSPELGSHETSLDLTESTATSSHCDEPESSLAHDMPVFDAEDIVPHPAPVPHDVIPVSVPASPEFAPVSLDTPPTLPSNPASREPVEPLPPADLVAAARPGSPEHDLDLAGPANKSMFINSVQIESIGDLSGIEQDASLDYNKTLLDMDQVLNVREEEIVGDLSNTSLQIDDVPGDVPEPRPVSPPLAEDDASTSSSMMVVPAEGLPLEPASLGENDDVSADDEDQTSNADSSVSVARSEPPFAHDLPPISAPDTEGPGHVSFDAAVSPITAAAPLAADISMPLDVPPLALADDRGHSDESTGPKSSSLLPEGHPADLAFSESEADESDPHVAVVEDLLRLEDEEVGRVHDDEVDEEEDDDEDPPASRARHPTAVLNIEAAESALDEEAQAAHGEEPILTHDENPIAAHDEDATAANIELEAEDSKPEIEGEVASESGEAELEPELQVEPALLSDTAHDPSTTGAGDSNETEAVTEPAPSDSESDEDWSGESPRPMVGSYVMVTESKSRSRSPDARYGTNNKAPTSSVVLPSTTDTSPKKPSRPQSHSPKKKKQSSFVPDFFYSRRNLSLSKGSRSSLSPTKSPTRVPSPSKSPRQQPATGSEDDQSLLLPITEDAIDDLADVGPPAWAPDVFGSEASESLIVDQKPPSEPEPAGLDADNAFLGADQADDEDVGHAHDNDVEAPPSLIDSIPAPWTSVLHTPVMGGFMHGPLTPMHPASPLFPRPQSPQASSCASSVDPDSPCPLPRGRTRTRRSRSRSRSRSTGWNASTTPIDLDENPFLDESSLAAFGETPSDGDNLLDQQPPEWLVDADEPAITDSEGAEVGDASGVVGVEDEPTLDFADELYLESGEDAGDGVDAVEGVVDDLVEPAANELELRSSGNVASSAPSEDIHDEDVPAPGFAGAYDKEDQGNDGCSGDARDGGHFASNAADQDEEVQQQDNGPDEDLPKLATDAADAEPTELPAESEVLAAVELEDEGLDEPVTSMGQDDSTSSGQDDPTTTTGLTLTDEEGSSGSEDEDDDTSSSDRDDGGSDSESDHYPNHAAATSQHHDADLALPRLRGSLPSRSGSPYNLDAVDAKYLTESMFPGSAPSSPLVGQGSSSRSMPSTPSKNKSKSKKSKKSSGSRSHGRSGRGRGGKRR